MWLASQPSFCPSLLLLSSEDVASENSSRKCFSRKLLCIFPFLAYVQIEGRDNCFWFEIHTEHGVWKTQKKYHSTLRAKRATFTFWVKLIKICQKWSILASFWKPEAFCQTVLPDRSVLIRQKFVENAKKFKISNATFWVIVKQCTFRFMDVWSSTLHVFLGRGNILFA